MANNTQAPRPPLPFGDTASFPKEVAPSLRHADDLSSITDVTSLMSEQTYQFLTIGGELGLPSSRVMADTTLEGAPLFARLPFILTCQRWIQQGRYIVCRVNPSEVQWRMPQRSVQQKTRQGEVIHVWRDNPRNTFYDEPQITLQFQSGNIMPIRRKPPLRGEAAIEQMVEQQSSYGVTGEQGNPYKIPMNPVAYDTSETEPVVPDGLRNFYEFLDLVDEQKILDSGDVNFVYIIYNSRMFPSITLAGLFTPDGVSWSDSADNPNQVQNWSATFTIYDSYPKLSRNLETMLRFFQSAGFGRV